MDIGDILIFGGKRFYVRGFDPVGVDPRFVYLEDAKTGRTISIAWEETRSGTSSDSVLRLVDDSPNENRSPD